MKTWTWREGRRGYTVKAYESRRGGMVYLKTYVDGKPRKRSLGFPVRGPDGEIVPELEERAKAEARRLYAKILDGASDDGDGPVTIRFLERLYEEHVIPDLSPGVRDDNRRRWAFWRAVLGESFDVRGFDERHWVMVRRDRLAGAIDARGQRVPETERRPTSLRTLLLDLQVLKRAVRLALTTRAPGRGRLRFYLERDPLLVVERDLKELRRRAPRPRRPLMERDRLARLLEVAPQVHPHLAPLLRVAEGHFRRIGACLRLKWSDVDLQTGTVLWRATGKTPDEAVIELTDDMRAAFEEVRQLAPGVGDAPVFPAVKDRARPLPYETAYSWLRRAEKLAGLAPVRHLAFHGLRRLGATETQGLGGDASRAHIGGWRDSTVLERLYEKPYREEVRRVLARRQRLVQEGGGT